MMGHMVVILAEEILKNLSLSQFWKIRNNILLFIL